MKTEKETTSARRSGRGESRGESPSKPDMATGAVTFLDVLGWKGIWLRREPTVIVQLLKDLAGLAVAVATGLRGKYDFTDTNVLSISDTIVLLTSGPANHAVPVHGHICQQLVCESIRKGIPLRGATSFGQYFEPDGSIMVGPAIDEAAAWHEALDWFGVVMTPTAEYSWEPKSPWCQYTKTPVKGLGSKELWCADWPEIWNNTAELRKTFAEAGPLDMPVAQKYMNTFSFYSFRKMKSIA